MTQHFHFEFETDEVARFLQRAIIFDAVLRWHKPDNKGFNISLFYAFLLIRKWNL